MVRDKYAVRLATEQREELQHLIRVGKSSARVTARARILLKSDDGWAAPQVAKALDVALGTVYRIKQRFTQEGLAGSLWDRRQANRHRRSQWYGWYWKPEHPPYGVAVRDLPGGLRNGWSSTTRPSTAVG